MWLRNASSKFAEIVCDCGKRYRQITVAGTDWSGFDGGCNCTDFQREAFEFAVNRLKELFRENKYLVVWVKDGRLFYTTDCENAPAEAVIKIADYLTDNA